MLTRTVWSSVTVYITDVNYDGKCLELLVHYAVKFLRNSLSQTEYKDHLSWGHNILKTMNRAGQGVYWTQCAKQTGENWSALADKLTQCVRQFIILIIKLVLHKS